MSSPSSLPEDGNGNSNNNNDDERRLSNASQGSLSSSPPLSNASSGSASTRAALLLPRPGSDHRRPHQDLRLSSSRSPVRPDEMYHPGLQGLAARGSGSSSVGGRVGGGSSSSSNSSGDASATPSVATQIASLHRAAEVARFEWRASYFKAIAERMEGERRQRRRGRQTGTAAAAAAAAAAATSQMTPGHSDEANVANRESRDGEGTNRSTGVGIIDISDDDGDGDDDEGGEDDDDGTSAASSNDTEEAVVAHTMRSTVERRRQQARQAQEAAPAGSPPLAAATSSLPAPPAGGSGNDARVGDRIHRDTDDLLVWDRMVNDLAVGAGVHPGGGHAVGSRPNALSPHGGNGHGSDNGGGGGGGGGGGEGASSDGRGRVWYFGSPSTLDSRITSGIAASMLALSASVPRSNTNSGGSHYSRPLPHPIWARRYPGAAGEWLRGELARRAEAGQRQQQQQRQAASIPVIGFNDVWDRSSSPLAAPSASAAAPALAPVAMAPPTDAPPSGPAGGTRRAWGTTLYPQQDRYGGVRGAQEAITSRAPGSIAVDATTSQERDAPAQTAQPQPQVSVQDALQEPSVDARATTSSGGAAEPQAQAEENMDAAARQAAADTIARLAQASRERNAAAAARGDAAPRQQSQAENSATRATRGGMDYIRRLRHLDGLEERAASAPSSGEAQQQQQAQTQEEEHPLDPSSRPRPFEVFPWYHPRPLRYSLPRTSAVEGPASQAQVDGMGMDPDGDAADWYTAARARIEAQHQARTAEENNDPDGEALLSEDEDAGEEQIAPSVADGGGTAARFRMRRSATYRNPEAQAQRRRNRAALVMADGFAASANDADGQAAAPASSVMGAVNARAAAEGWTLIEQRPRSPVRVTTSEVNEPPTLRTMNPIGTYTDQRTSSPVRETADEGSENVTTWFRDPAQPSRWLSTSPGPMGRSSLPPLASSAARSETNPAALPQRRGEISLSRRRTTDVDDPRTTRRPRRLASLTDDVVRRVESILDQQSAANLSRTLDIDDNDERVPQIAPQAPLRERQSSSPRPIPRHFTRERQDEFWGRSLREDTPPPEERRGDEEGNGDRQDTLAATSAQIALLHQRAEASLRQSRRLTDMGVRLEQEFRARQDELRVREERLRLEVARRRAEVDALRQREGRIGRVLSGRSEATEEREATMQRLEEREPLLGGEAGGGGGGQPSSPTSPSGSSLVRRRSVRESGLGPMTRSYIRLLQDGHIASSRMTRRSVEMPNGAQAPRRRANSSPSVEEADRPQFLAAAPAPASADGRPGTKDDLVVADASQLRSPRVFTPLLTDEDKAKLGQSGLALMRLVDEAAGPTVKKLIMHAKLKRLAMQWTPMQPDLPDTLEGGAEYPLRFQARVVRHYGKGDEAKIDAAQCILTKDESGLEFNAGKDEIVLRFLAAVVGRSTPAAEPTSVTAGRVPTSQRDARLAASPPGYMTLLQRHREARLEDRDWARARERIIGQANNVDARRRALGLPPRDAVRPAPAPTTNAASRSEADIVFEHQQQQQQQQQPVPLERDGGAPSEDDDVEGWSMHEGAPGTRHCAGEEEKQLPSVALSSDQWRLIEHVKGRARSRISPARRLEAGDADTLKASDFVPIVCGNVGMAGRLLVEDRAVSLARAQTKREEEEEPKGRTAKENTFSLGQIVIQVDVPRARWSAGSGWTAKEAKRVKGLVFVESSSQRLDERLAEYRRVETVDDFKMLAKKMAWSAVDGLESIGEEARKRKAAKAPWRAQSFDDDDDESLGDPFAVEKTATKDKDKNKGKGASSTVAPPAAVFETDARGRASVFASGDDDGQIEKRRLEGSYIGITLLRDEHESSDDKHNIKVLWVEAFGQAGRRSFGAASLR